jgi:hypothetical protein
MTPFPLIVSDLGEIVKVVKSEFSLLGVCPNIVPLYSTVQDYGLATGVYFNAKHYPPSPLIESQ